MKTVTQQRLVEILRNVTHATPVGFVALTNADAKVTANPFGTIYKLTKVNALTGCDYEGSVNRRLYKEGKEPYFQASGRSNQTERIGPCLARKVVNGEEKFYLPVQIQHVRSPLYLVRRPIGLGRSVLTAVSKEQVAAFLPTPRKAAHQGTDKEIVYRDYALQSITQMNINGERYRIRA